MGLGLVCSKCSSFNQFETYKINLQFQMCLDKTLIRSFTTTGFIFSNRQKKITWHLVTFASYHLHRLQTGKSEFTSLVIFPSSNISKEANVLDSIVWESVNDVDHNSWCWRLLALPLETTNLKKGHFHLIDLSLLDGFWTSNTVLCFVVWSQKSSWENHSLLSTSHLGFSGESLFILIILKIA